MMQETVDAIVGTAGEVALDNYLESLFANPAKLQYLNIRTMYREAAVEALTGRFGNVGWLRSADGSLADVNKAAELFNSQANWSEAVSSPDYERISAKVFNHATKGLVRRFGS